MTGCSGKSSSELKTLSPYATVTLTAGTGLGNLQLGKTTLGWVAGTIGSGSISGIAGDESAIELTFLNGEISFLFIVSGVCQRETGGPGVRLDLDQDLKVFLSRYPGCQDLPLSSLSVATGESSKTGSFFKGSTDRGVQLWSPKCDAYKHGVELNRAGQLVPGESYGNENLGRLEFAGGIYFYYPRGEGATAQEEMSGRALSPERLRDIEESEKGAAKNAVIKRITIFMPN